MLRERGQGPLPNLKIDLRNRRNLRMNNEKGLSTVNSLSDCGGFAFL